MIRDHCHQEVHNAFNAFGCRTKKNTLLCDYLPEQQGRFNPALNKVMIALMLLSVISHLLLVKGFEILRLFFQTLCTILRVEVISVKL